MDDVRNVPTYLRFETIFGCILGSLILGFIITAFWFLLPVGIVLLFARLVWEIKHPLTKEQKEQLKVERAKAVEELQKMTAKAVKCPHCNSTNVEFMQQQKKGFSVGKAAAGTVLTGSVGALAGFAGKKGKKEWHCKNCGTVFTTKK